MRKSLVAILLVSAGLFTGLHRAAGEDVASTLPKLDALEYDPAPKEPLHIGSEKQLFVDRHIVGSTDETCLTMIPPRRHPANPILTPRSPWEGPLLMAPELVRGNSEKRVFQMWYDTVHAARSGRNNAGTVDSQLHLPAYAESRDGLAWDRPILNVRDFDGSSANNLVEGVAWDMIYDEHDPDAGRRYKRVTWWKGPDVGVWFSPDGIRWRASPKNPVLSPTGDTPAILGWDPRHRKYVGYFRPVSAGGAGSREQGRRIGISFSDDFENWSPVVTILSPDDHDPVGTEFYWMRVVRYEGVYLGVLAVLHLDRKLLDLKQSDPAGFEQTVDLQLAVSRDGLHWRRVGNRAAWLAVGPYQSWEDKVLWPGVPILVGDEIRFYYSGQNVRHHYLDQNTGGKKVDGLTSVGAIGLATLRRDGWVAARPNYQGRGVLSTRSFTFKGEALEVNAAADHGRITIEALDESSQPIAGFSGADAAEVKGDSVRHRVPWGRPISALQAKPIRLRFVLEKAALYAFQFVPAAQ
jgi:hypothetical protein